MGTNGATLHQHTDVVGTIALFGIGSVNLHRLNLWLASILCPDQDEHAGVLQAQLEGRDGDPLLTSFLLRKDALQSKRKDNGYIAPRACFLSDIALSTIE